MRRFRVLVLAMLMLACSSSDDGHGSTPSRGLVFKAEPQPQGASVTLRQKELRDGQLVLELVGHGVSDVYGLAFRMKYDPAVLTFAGLEAGPTWGNAPPIALGRAPQPGLLLGVISKKGKSAGIAANDVVLASVTLSVVAKTASPVELVAGRSSLVAGDGKPIAGVSFTGGVLQVD